MLVMIDNYDSFTHNLVRYFRELGQKVEVFRNDKVSIQALRDLKPSGIVISPGPGTPDDAGISLKAIESFVGSVPVLGVCLGHQAIAQAYGGSIVRAQQIMHGKTSMIESRGTGLFTELPQHFTVTRYHSLVVAADTLSHQLSLDAWVSGAREPEIMGFSSASERVFGIQFHPESVLTEYGHNLLARFCQVAGLVVNADIQGLSSSLR